MASGLTELANLIVEDGDGIADANSYQTLAAITAYANLRQYGPFTAWGNANESNQVAAAIEAARYMDVRWSFDGYISYENTGLGDPQTLKWPRTNSVDIDGIAWESDEIPLQILNAHSEYAARAIDATTLEAVSLQSDLVTQDESGRFIERTREKLGPLESETRYSTSKRVHKWPRYGSADQILLSSGLIVTRGNRSIRA